MEYIQVIIQAIIQGLTEFLPVSSSGHLSVVQHFMDIGEQSLLISVFLHLGTLVAVFIAFWPTIWGMIKEFFLSLRDMFTGRFSWDDMNDNRRMMFMVILSTMVLVPAYLFRDYFVCMEGDGDIIFEGCAFLFTALLLFLADACKKGYKTGRDMNVIDALVVGIGQCVALFPGVSRSGTTLTCGLFCGLSKETAVSFAFILGIPAILGGSALELYQAVKTDVAIEWGPMLVGFVVAGVVGFMSIKFVKFILKNDKFKYFGFYTAALGVACIGYGIYEMATKTVA